MLPARHSESLEQEIICKKILLQQHEQTDIITSTRIGPSIENAKKSREFCKNFYYTYSYTKLLFLSDSCLYSQNMNYELKQPLNIAQKTQLDPFILSDIQNLSSGAWIFCVPLNKGNISNKSIKKRNKLGHNVLPK